MKKECRTIFLTVGVLIIFLAFAFSAQFLSPGETDRRRPYFAYR
jgi:hypothetical protein